MNLSGFVRESNLIEGITREPTKNEVSATEKFLALSQMNLTAVCELVAAYEPGAKLRDKRNLNVRVGEHLPPKGGPKVVETLEHILDASNRGFYSAYHAHCLYELLHPFTDGNGRSGRAIWLWIMKDAPLNFLHHFYYQSLQNYLAKP